MSDKIHNVTRVDFTRGSRVAGPAGAAARKLTAGVPLAMVIPRKLVPSSDTVMLKDPRSLPAEMYRRVRAFLASRPELTQVVVVSSAGSGDGKATAATNLALAYAESGSKKVLLLDADMRMPRIQKWIEPQPRIGLAEVLSGEAGLDDAVHYLKNASLKFLPAGVPPIDPLQRLQSNAWIDLLCRLRERYDTIIIDAPPVLAFPDADVIGDLSDGALLVVKAGVTTRRNYLTAIESLRSTKVLGSIRCANTLNLADLRPIHESIQPSCYQRVPRNLGRRGFFSRFRKPRIGR